MTQDLKEKIKNRNEMNKGQKPPSTEPIYK